MTSSSLDVVTTTERNALDDVPDMTFSSSPVLYPLSSSPAPIPIPKQKRRLFQTLDIQQPLLKKPRLTSDEDLAKIPKDGNLTISDSDILTTREIEHETTTNVQALKTSETIVTPPAVASSTSFSASFGRGLTRKTVELQTCTGQTIRINGRKKHVAETYEQVVANRSITASGKASRAHYGIEIHQLIDDAKAQAELDKAAKEVQMQKEVEIRASIERPVLTHEMQKKQAYKHQMWTEKYRAKKFTELVGDERTHRSVLKWFKAWDSTVFPTSVKAKTKKIYEDKDASQEQQHRKIMLLTGPPGLGKTTLAHVCAKQAGYEVLEINASDDRSRDVVKGRIKDALGTENVRGIQEPGKARKAGRPVCVVVDEVDGVVTGSGGSGGEGGFMKALIDLVQLDQKNNSQPTGQDVGKSGKRKGDKFRFLRPLILICNDVYAPSLRPLRNSAIAEIVHVRKPPLEKVVARLKTVFEKESIHCDNDAVRRLCEDCWGLGSRKQSSHVSRGTGDGDIRGVLVHGEWMAHKLRQNNDSNRLTRKWIEAQISEAASSKGMKGLARGGVREVVDRIFVEGAGLPNLPVTLSADEARQVKESKANPLGVADLRKRTAISALREMVDTCGDHDRLMTDCFSTYGTHVFQDDTYLSKPNAGYDWLHFHDSLSSRIFSGQEWELNPYLSSSACAFHNLYSAIDKGTSSWNNDTEKHDSEERVHPFSGMKADFAAYEAEKQNRTVLTEMQGSFSAELLRLFSSTDTIATELIPSVSRIVSPDVKPVVVGGVGGGAAVASVRKESERNCVRNSVRVMNALNISFEKVRIETEGFGGSSTSGGYALRMEPPLDTLSSYFVSPSSSSKPHQPSTKATQPTRYAVRQVLDQELYKEKILQASLSRQARANGPLIDSPSTLTATPGLTDDNKENLNPHQALAKPKVKRDFFGRPIQTPTHLSLPGEEQTEADAAKKIDASSIAKSTAMKGRAASDVSGTGAGTGRVWVSFHEGFSNAVRKPISLADLLDGF